MNKMPDHITDGPHEPDENWEDLKKVMEESTQYFWRETPSSIYPSLRELEQSGLVDRKSCPSEGGRERNLYTLTAEGQKKIDEWLGIPAEPWQIRSELLLKLFFGQFVPTSANYKQVEEYRINLLKNIESFSRIKSKLQSDHKGEAGLPYWLITVQFGLKQAQSALEWCEESLIKIKKLEQNKT